MVVVRHIKLHWEYLKVATTTALEYRINFLIQVASMFINDLIWIVFWLIFFTKFQVVAGWKFQDMMLLYTVITLSYGLTGVLFGNRSQLASMISQGKIDFYLTLPKNVLHHILISRSSWYDFGDVIFGIVLGVIAVPFVKWPLLFILIILSSTIYLSYNLIVGSLSFYIGNSEEISKNMIMGGLSLASYPVKIYTGISRIIIFTVIPAGFITGVPVELLRSFDLTWFLILTGFCALILSFAMHKQGGFEKLANVSTTASRFGYGCAHRRAGPLSRRRHMEHRNVA